MAAVKNSDTSPELLVRSALHRRGFRFRKDVRSMPGRPDIVLPKWRAVVFVHGCYWHRHTCRRGQSVPTARRKFWLEKFQANVVRDARNVQKLKGEGWRVFTVWECDLKKNTGATIERLAQKIERSSPSA